MTELAAFLLGAALALVMLGLWLDLQESREARRAMREDE